MAKEWRRISIVASALFAVSANAASTPVDNLLAFFGSSCPSQGAWTQAALGKAAALRTTLEELVKDPDCSAFSAESSTASAIATSLAILQQQNVNNTTDITLATQETAILSSMTTITDPEGLRHMQDLLARVDAKAVSTRANDRLIVQSEAANQLVASTHNFVQRALDNQKCVLNRPGLLAGIGSLVANVGSAVTAVNPALGLGASALGTLMADMTSLFNQRKLMKGIRRLNDGAIRPAAISCVLESLTTDFCRAQDAVTAIDWSQAHRVRSNYPIDSPLYGLGILDRELDAFNRWLGKVKVSRLAQNPADAARVKNFRDLETAFFNSADGFSGAVGPFRSQLENVTDPAKRWPIVRTMIVSIMSALGAPSNYSPEVNNPLFATKTRNEAEFFLIGIDASKLDKPNGTTPSFEGGFSPKDLERQTIPQVMKTGIADIQLQFDTWLADTKILVDDQRAQVLQPDVMDTLESAFNILQDYNRDGSSPPRTPPEENIVSPYESLLAIGKYLQRQLDANPRSSESFYYLPNTIARLSVIKEQLELLHKPDQKRTDRDYGKILAEIYTQANLQEGRSFLENRISGHINSALVRYLSNPANARDTAPILAQTLASERMTDVLTKSNPRGDIGLARQDIRKSITIVLPTLNAFVGALPKEIRGVLEFLREEEARYASDPATSGTFADERAKICLMLANLDVWPEKVPYALCEGTSFTTLANGPRSPRMTGDYMSKPFAERACGYYRLQRDTLVHQATLDLRSR